MSKQHIKELAELVGCTSTIEDGGVIGMYTAWWGPEGEPLRGTFEEMPQAQDLAPIVLEYIKERE